mmetsp:Transcript_6391/g.12048  ORF Transcript_6391/g.12048 Transcript_6391/m.12048 type:complete len:85 (-) Transcript_6391:1082-1336(-)
MITKRNFCFIVCTTYCCMYDYNAPKLFLNSLRDMQPLGLMFCPNEELEGAKDEIATSVTSTKFNGRFLIICSKTRSAGPCFLLM